MDKKTYIIIIIGVVTILGTIFLNKLFFSGESPLTIRARLVCRRDCPNPLGIVLWSDKLSFICVS